MKLGLCGNKIYGLSLLHTFLIWLSYIFIFTFHRCILANTTYTTFFLLFNTMKIKVDHKPLVYTRKQYETSFVEEPKHLILSLPVVMDSLQNFWRICVYVMYNSFLDVPYDERIFFGVPYKKCILLGNSKNIISDSGLTQYFHYIFF